MANTETETTKYAERGEPLKPILLRLPPGTLGYLDAYAEEQKITRNRAAIDLLTRMLKIRGHGDSNDDD